MEGKVSEEKPVDYSSEEENLSEDGKKVKKLSRNRASRNLGEVWKQVWNELDIQGENDTIVMEAELQKLLDTLEDQQQQKQTKIEKVGTSDPNTQAKFKNYNGPTLEGEKINIGFILEMIAFFKKGGVLHYDIAKKIVERTAKLHDSCPNVVSHTIIPPSRFTVVGDLHGQFVDLLTIFSQNGMPSDTNGYLFNGDFVDRGRRGLEVLLTIYSFKLLYPQYVYLNRGNHEQRHINTKYGFEEQVRTKYDGDFFNLIQLSFRVLPLATIIDEKIFVLHGGLFSNSNMTINDLQKSVRKIDIPGGARHESERTLEEVLWSDPRVLDGWARSARGAGIVFGPDVTEKFLNNNKLEIMIRSHEMKDNGWSRIHNGKLITVFSASNYCRTNENKGAYVVITHKNSNEERDAKNAKFSHDYNFYSYTADNQIDYLVNPKRNTEDHARKQTIKILREKIYENRHDLLVCFTRMDLNKDGRINSEEWANALNSVLQLNIPWLELEPFLIKDDPPGKINYMKFVERYKIQIDSELSKDWTESLISKICVKLYETSGDLSKAFQKIDLNSDGCLTYDEFVDALSKQGLGLSNDQLYDLMKSIDKDQSGSIDLGEFTERFQVSFNKIKEEKESWIQKAANEIGNILFREKRTIQAAFSEFDEDKNGALSYREVSLALTRLGVSYSDEEKTKIAAWIDEDGNGEISFKEFRNAFKIIDSQGSDWQDYMIQKVCGILFKNKLQLQGVFRRLDSQGTGRLAFSDFKIAIEVLNQQIGSPVSPLQLRELYKSVSDESGMIEYERFLGSFRLVDETKKKISSSDYGSLAQGRASRSLSRSGSRNPPPAQQQIPPQKPAPSHAPIIEEKKPSKKELKEREKAEKEREKEREREQKEREKEKKGERSKSPTSRFSLKNLSFKKS
eukprot:TRINITY_DN3132_c0_g1_i2.p1 TRINITY_DN3132_c0_g1~~TRINITY_DN3132_c0_g1_i2.p1  ORF type:complete len:906 (-),score=379.45 TRINITY_DN3132_c0_g1_i2:34-2751(-)